MDMRRRWAGLLILPERSNVMGPDADRVAFEPACIQREEIFYSTITEHSSANLHLALQLSEQVFHVWTC